MAADSWMPYEMLLDELKRGELELEHKKLFLKEASEKVHKARTSIEEQKRRRDDLMMSISEIEEKTMGLSSQISDAEQKLTLFNCEVQRLEDLENQIHLKKVGKQKEIFVLNDHLYKVGHDFATQTLYKSCDITSQSQPLDFIVEKHLKGKQEITDAIEKTNLDCENLRKEIDSFITKSKTDHDQTQRLFNSIHETLDDIDACIERSFHSQLTEAMKNQSNSNVAQPEEQILAGTEHPKAPKSCKKVILLCIGKKKSRKKGEMSHIIYVYLGFLGP
ncbi:uncharacterized protein LOC136028465 [Artemia franciscana]|uniref:uncharacterized protein LOC136028465 n=1 Tax=Artemia franciscana TaxID=6661 RepID=UPI0032DBF1DA